MFTSVSKRLEVLSNCTPEGGGAGGRLAILLSLVSRIAVRGSSHRYIHTAVKQELGSRDLTRDACYDRNSTHAPTHSPTYPPTRAPTHPPIHPPPTHSPTHQLTYPPNHPPIHHPHPLTHIPQRQTQTHPRKHKPDGAPSSVDDNSERAQSPVRLLRGHPEAVGERRRQRLRPLQAANGGRPIVYCQWLEVNGSREGGGQRSF